MEETTNPGLVDTQANRIIMTRLLYTTGNGQFLETEWQRPTVQNTEIAVKTIMTGVCRSDIDMMEGNFGPLTLSMQGHEGLGQVIEVGNEVTDVKIGDFVATRGEPAYADEYNVRAKEYVKVPEASPKYILEPVACGVNVVSQPLTEIQKRSGTGKRLLILGSGFLAWIAYNSLKLFQVEFDITVVGNSNKDLWQDVLSHSFEGSFDVVIDLSPRADVFDTVELNPQALFIFGSQKKVNTDFGALLWKACTIIFPSPRTSNFHHAMILAEEWITNGKISVDKFWTRGYNRNIEWNQAFTDGVNRPLGYSRGYIYWD